jgi:hypothetical protein
VAHARAREELTDERCALAAAARLAFRRAYLRCKIRLAPDAPVGHTTYVLRGGHFAIAVGALVVACGQEPATSAAPPVAAKPAPADNPCADGFALDSDGACIDAPAPAACPGGTRPRLGSSTCEPVGWQSSCPAGTKRDASGFACMDAAPAAPCAGATREAQDQASCVPVGDCTGPFPPAGAIVVDASLSDGQVDATHVRTLSAGVAAAADGATVAVAAGTYDDAVTLTKHVTLVGRCAASVEIRSPAGSMKPGIDVRTTGVTVRGLTLTGHVKGIAVAVNAAATVEDVVVRGARHSGLYVEGGRATIRGTKVEDTRPQADRRGGFDLAVGVGGEASLFDSTLSGGVQGVLAGGADTKVALTRVVITKQAPNADSEIRATGMAVVSGARVTVAQSVIRDLVGDGAAVVQEDGVVDLTDTIVRDVHVGGAAARGYGLLAMLGGHLVVRSSQISAIERAAVLVRDQGSSLELVASTVRGPNGNGATPPPGLISDGKGAGVSVVGKAKASLDSVAILGTWGISAYADTGGALEMKRSFVDAPRGFEGGDPARGYASGLNVNGATAVVSDVTVTHCSGSAVGVGKGGRLRGDRLFVRDVVEGATESAGSGLSVGANGDVDLDASVIDRATSTGIIVTEGGGSILRLARSSIHGTRPARMGFGHGITVRNEARVVLTGTSIVDNPGIGLAADGGRALLDGAAVARNAVGIHAQGGSFLVEADDPDADGLGAGEVRVTASTRFASNATRIGSGVVPLPAPILP